MENRSRAVLLAAVFTLTLAGCRNQPVRDVTPSKGPAPEPTGPPMSGIPFRSLEVRPNSALSAPERTVLLDRTAFLAAWQRAHAGLDPGIILPAVDAARQVVVLVALGERPSGGHAIRVTAVESRGDSLLVHVESTRPGPDCMSAAVMTQPFEFVAIGWHGPAERVRFVERERIGDCK